MSIIKLSEPWCFNAMSLEQSEVGELQKHFVNEDNHQCDWSNTDYCGITSDGLSEYFSSPEFFDEDDDNNKTTVYTIKQLRDIIAEHLAKQPVEPESVTKFVVGKWYKWFQKDHGREQKGKCATLYDSHFEMKPWICNSSEYIESGMFNLRDAESIEIIEDLSEIQDLLPEGHPDKWVKTEPKSERYLATMKFFEQLREPERSEAIANYDEDYGSGTKVPKDLAEAINYGFEWSSTKQEHEYWMVIKDEIMSGIYFQEEILVFGKYKVGVIVVSLKCVGKHRKIGEMFAVLSDSSKNRLYFEPMTCSTEPESWRPATPEEVEAYNQGVRSVADIKPKSKRAVAFNSEEERRHILAHFNPGGISLSGVNKGWICLDKGTWSLEWDIFEKDRYIEMSFQDWCKEFNHPFDYKEAVHCTTQEEWDFVLSKFNGYGPSKSTFTRHKESCLTTVCNKYLYGYCSKEWHIEEGYTILTFKQWCKKYGHSYEAVPKYVECVKSHQSPYYTVGKIYTWPNTISDSGKSNKPGILKGSVWEFKPSTKEAYDKQQEKLKMEKLLSEAKRRYPTGTKVRAVLDGPELTTEIFTLTDSHYWASGSKVPACYTEEGHPVCLHLSGKWAEIVKEEPKPTEIKPAKGMHVRCLKENSWSDGKTKIGQIFVIEDVDWSGDMWVNNNSFAKERLGRGEFELLPNYKEEPWIAQVGDWVYTLPGSSGWGMSVKDEEKIFKVKEITNNWCEETRVVLDGSSNPTKKSSTIDPITLPNLVRKATQEEIDSVTKPEKKDSIFDQLRESMFDSDMTWHKLHSTIEKHKPQQDELVIYKPKQTRLVEPGAVSASASTINLIIKSNSKYL